MRGGLYDEAELEDQLNNRGFMNRFLGRVTRAIRKPWQMYPVGVLFGSASTPRPRWPCSSSPAERRPPAALVRDHRLPVLFAAGMSPARHDRRVVHELRVRLGLLPAGPQGLLQHHDHRSVGRGPLLVGTRAAVDPGRKLGLTAGRWTFVGGLDLNHVGYRSSGSSSSPGWSRSPSRTWATSSRSGPPTCARPPDRGSVAIEPLSVQSDQVQVEDLEGGPARASRERSSGRRSEADRSGGAVCSRRTSLGGSPCPDRKGGEEHAAGHRLRPPKSRRNSRSSGLVRHVHHRPWTRPLCTRQARRSGNTSPASAAAGSPLGRARPELDPMRRTIRRKFRGTNGALRPLSYPRAPSRQRYLPRRDATP